MSFGFGFGVWGLGFGVWVLNFGFWVLGLRFGVSDFGFTPCPCFRVDDRYHVQCLEFIVEVQRLGLRFRI